mmetsp:Transcript_29818/g.95369  ORF Transcript_29818/g.95369 Transcript_29818/m.95369 type:complete len:233 (+) Transcript_29818:1624-2322(+)
MSWSTAALPCQTPSATSRFAARGCLTCCFPLCCSPPSFPVLPGARLPSSCPLTAASSAAVAATTRGWGDPHGWKRRTERSPAILLLRHCWTALNELGRGAGGKDQRAACLARKNHSLLLSFLIQPIVRLKRLTVLLILPQTLHRLLAPGEPAAYFLMSVLCKAGHSLLSCAEMAVDHWSVKEDETGGGREGEEEGSMELYGSSLTMEAAGLGMIGRTAVPPVTGRGRLVKVP